ncbi:uncharacterized protein Dere_GG26782 [Drosophila erecta]|uniref:BPTI/Kunitz inhibitor domain-containing protein n=1 Tax=Drosophila erecta TaxID=7220 RepID=A0A0Q5U5I7_DROER|nr:uncharacterized protein Dere_GG26782 [Drosophila erecta]
MNFIVFLACFTLSVAFANCQFLCRARISNPTCFGPRNVGTALGFACALNFTPRIWYFNGESRRCETMPYLGCGGNSNRFCSLQDCRLNCLQFKR